MKEDAYFLLLILPEYIFPNLLFHLNFSQNLIKTIIEVIKFYFQ